MLVDSAPLAGGPRDRLVSATTELIAYLAIEDPLGPADAIWGLGSNDGRVAEIAADVFAAGLASLVVFSGGTGHRWRDLGEPEAELFRHIALERGVPDDRIVVEASSTNTGENVRFTLEILERLRYRVDSVVLVTIPPFQRRAAATVRRHRPSMRCVCRPVDWGPIDRLADDRLAMAAQLCVGEVRRLREYPVRGYIARDEGDVPDSVVEAAVRAQAALGRAIVE